MSRNKEVKYMITTIDRRQILNIILILQFRKAQHNSNGRIFVLPDKDIYEKPIANIIVNDT